MNANKIVIALVAALSLLMLVLAVGSNSCNSAGKGAHNSSSASGGAGHAASADEENAYDYSAVEGAEKDMTIEEFEALLEQSSAVPGENVRSAADSALVPSAKNVYEEFDNRGFVDLAVTGDFDLEGNYSESRIFDATSDEKIPSYTSIYVSAGNVVWIIYVNEGRYFAVPLGSEARMLSKNIVVSETDYVIQYDGFNNEFSDFKLTNVPDSVGVKVARVDKATLDSYTLESLEAM